VTEFTLPNNWQPRPYQNALWSYLEGGGKRAFVVAHRRWGKDDVALHWTACAAHQRVGTYWHMLPEASQARKAVWEAINPHTGIRRIDEAFPIELRAGRSGTRENEMYIRFKCGSTWQVVGSDNYNSLVGSPPIGIVFSEFALADPSSWAYLRPILAENGGWAVFITTPRGRNHASVFYEGAKDDPLWYTQLSPATQTSVFTSQQLDQERGELVREYGPDDGDARFRQEYLCSFSAGVVGAYYGSLLERAESEGRFTSVPWEPTLPVHTAWDLGIGDATAIWLFQLAGREIHCIDYIENSGVGVDWYVKELDKRPYKWGQHHLPHDAKAKELTTGKTREEVLWSLGLTNTHIVAKLSLEDGINATRATLPLCWFDKDKCARGISCLQNYRRNWSEELRVYQDTPRHDWASHGADAFRYLSLSGARNRAGPKKIKYPSLGIV